MGYYLMVKTAIPTGLRYLCKCADYKNPNTYRGSGVYWRRHLIKNNCTWTTEILGHFDTNEQLAKEGLRYSNLWNVVESKEWANYIPEIGDGGPTIKGKVRAYNIETEQQKCFDNKEQIPEGWIHGCPGFKKSEQSKEKTRLFHVGRKRSEETRVNMRNSSRRKRMTVQCTCCGIQITKQNIQRHMEKKHG